MLATKLNQIVAILNGNTGRKALCEKAVKAIYRVFDKKEKDNATAFVGLARSYRPAKEGEEQLPGEHKQVPCIAKDLVEKAGKEWTKMLDTVLTQDVANTEATGDIIIDGVVLAAAVPVTFLMVLEKHMTDVHTVMLSLPELPPDRKWTWSNDSACYVAPVEETTRPRKIEFWLHAEDATEKHPAQGKWTTRDEIAGYWSATPMSGAMPKAEKQKIVARALQLLEAIRKARESANMMVVTDQHIGATLFDYINNGTMPSTK